MLAMPCSNCGAPTVAGFRLCGACGAPLPGAPAIEGIQRVATVVTSDLKGSTALGERLDPESLREVLTLYFDEMQAVFRSNGGTIEKIIGDAIVAVFGLPVHHHDDALRAVEAARETQVVLSSLNDRLEQTWGVRLVVRTGVATGVVVVGQASHGQHVLTGETMQTSSVMEQNAPPFDVLISQATFDLVRDRVTVTAVDPVAAKGSSGTVPAYRLDSVEPRIEAGRALADQSADGVQRCPVCGEKNPEDGRLCGMCGATLAAALPFRESRKTVTIVFADPKPTMLDGERPSPEILRDAMSEYFEAMKVALEGHGGTVEKFIGDAVMAVFGLPVRHEDDALRAVRGAAAMQAALPALNDSFRSRWRLELHNHIGVNTGEVIAGDATVGQRLVTGDAVNTAARLEQAAGAQEIILGGLTYRLARDQIEVEPIPPLTLKGKTEPVPAYRLVRVAQRPTEASAPTTPFVGREAEMARLENTLDQVSASRTCRLVTVIGDAGVGKSRLVREFATRAASREHSQVLRGRCLPYGDGVTFWPIAEIVRSAAGISDEDPSDVAMAKIAAIATAATGDSEDPTAIIDRVAAAIGLTTTQFAGPELFWGIRKLLEAIAGRRPLVAIVDDIHVAAPTFLELLDHLLDAVHGAPILLLTTARHELLEARQEWAVSHEAEQVILEPLSVDDAGAIIEQLLTGLEEPVRRRIVAAAEGNPLYVVQITAMLIETGAIRQEGDAWAATGSSAEIEIPPTVQALVAARLDALQDEERQVIDPASVIGLGFAVEAVASLVPVDVARAVPARLESLTTKQFVRPTASEEDFYRFGHSVIKDAAYRSLLKRTRAELHQRFVDWAEPVNRERGREVEFEEILGYHLEQAYQYRGQLGPIDSMARELGTRASEKLASAGRRAFLRGDAPAAASLLKRSTDVLPELDRDRIELLTELAEAEMDGGHFEAARETLDQARDAADRIEDERLKAREEIIRFHLALWVAGSVGDAGQVAAQVESMIQTFESQNDLAGLARAWRLLTVIYGTTGQDDRAADAAAHVVEAASRIDDSRLAARGAYNYAQAALSSSMPVAEALDRLDGLSDAVGLDRLAEARFLGIAAVLHAMEGDFDTARTMYRRSRELVADLGLSVTVVAAASLESSRVETLAGDPAAAERELRRDYEALEAVDERYFRSSVAGLLAHALWSLGRYQEAERVVGVAKDLSAEDDVFSQIIWRTVSAKLLARDGRAQEALDLAIAAAAMAGQGADIEVHADALLDLAEVQAILGDTEAQEPPLREALDIYSRKGDSVSADLTRSRLATLLPS
jgi:class 3 adenylate cyclase/tetratricopeptide (TPR) repeat protein